MKMDRIGGFRWEDPFLLEDELTEEERMIRDTARSYAQDRLAPRVREAFQKAFDVDGPALVEIITDPNALSLPPEITGEQLIGFATAMSKIVLNRGAGEAVSMATSNTRNIPRF